MACTKTSLIDRALEIALNLKSLADEGEEDGDDGCYVLCGVMRDCSYKIKKLVETERERGVVPRGWRNC